MNITDLSAQELASKIKSGQLSSTDAVKAFLDRAEKENPANNGFLTICNKSALIEAANIDSDISSGKSIGILAGVPIAIKDNISTKGIRTTCASKMLENYTPVFDATVVEKLRKEGAVIIGKTNLDEFAMGSTTENSYFGPSKNPLDPSRIPGGSSGGSAVVVAAKTAPAALGSDTGGSIRQPAACCGVVGLKPTYGRVSRYGLVAFASSLDQIGPITNNVTDAALLLQVIAGDDPRDSTSSPEKVPDYLNKLANGVNGLKVGLPKEYFADGLNKEVKNAVMSAASVLEKAGAELIEVSLPLTEYAVAVYYVIATAEATSNLARYDGVKYGFRSKKDNSLSELYANTRSEGFGAEVKRRIMLGNYVLSSGYYDAYYHKAQQVRTLLQQDFSKAFNECDMLICPTIPTPPFLIGEKVDDPLSMYLSDIYTISANLAGIPGLTLPFGKAGGMPVGVQLLGRSFSEEILLRAGLVIEKASI
ncbi:MAG: Asp-tRNA(Asn)/Glu-tRNA(Gln) amidotransferase subunit GatA [Fibrobacteres bacterium]|nr:Asp-tRNA(Asn)/Glu-tRNA(Gln) amidotransferase subunit GatA [Fibrobacterota bacterium]